MFVVSQSATGQFVITHPPTNTIMVGDDLLATFERMRAFADALEGPTQVSAPAVAAGRTTSRFPRLAIAALVLLPFVWLGVLHVSLGRLVAEMRTPATDLDDRKELRARIDRLESSLLPPERKPTKPRGPKKAAPAAAASEGADAGKAPSDAADAGKAPAEPAAKVEADDGEDAEDED